MILDICKKEGVAPHSCPVGIMLEIPAAVLSLPDFIPLADFVSIGTNDLVQYAFAACRDTSSLEEYRAASFPLLLRLVGSVVDATAGVRREVTVCGEIASDPKSAACLVGVGVRALSMRASSVRAVCQELSKKSVSDCVRMAKAICLS
jgi:phosphotransferase system enzyme I (PtsI)